MIWIVLQEHKCRPHPGIVKILKMWSKRSGTGTTMARPSFEQVLRASLRSFNPGAIWFHGCVKLQHTVLACFHSCNQQTKWLRWHSTPGYPKIGVPEIHRLLAKMKHFQWFWGPWFLGTPISLHFQHINLACACFRRSHSRAKGKLELAFLHSAQSLLCFSQFLCTSGLLVLRSPHSKRSSWSWWMKKELLPHLFFEQIDEPWRSDGLYRLIHPTAFGASMIYVLTLKWPRKRSISLDCMMGRTRNAWWSTWRRRQNLQQ